MALKAVHVSDVPSLDQVPESPVLSLSSPRLPNGTTNTATFVYQSPLIFFCNSGYLKSMDLVQGRRSDARLRGSWWSGIVGRGWTRWRRRIDAWRPWRRTPSCPSIWPAVFPLTSSSSTFRYHNAVIYIYIYRRRYRPLCFPLSHGRY